MKTACPHCGAEFEGAEEFAGREPECPECGGEFSVSIAPATVPATEAPPAGRIIAENEPLPDNLRPGDLLLGLYEVRELLGEGGMGQVYLIRHRSWETMMAMKVPRRGIFQNAAQRAQFIRECDTWVNLGLHPHVVTCHYVRDAGGTPVIFSEYADGGSLKEAIDDGTLYGADNRDALGRLLDLAIQFAWGIECAHRQGIVHQDIKPGNVLLTANGGLKVTDFGLAGAAVAAGVDAALMTSGNPLVSYGGMTPAYCSPEQARGEPVDKRTDIYSFGVSLLEMFAGGVLWPSGSLVGELLEEYLQADSGFRLAVPPELHPLLRSLLASDRSHRQADIASAADELARHFQPLAGRPYARQKPDLAAERTDVLNNRAISMLDLGRTEQAESMLNDALAHTPGHLPAIYNLGLLQWRAGRIGDLELLQRLAGEGHEASFLRGLVHGERGDFSSAQNEFGTITSGHYRDQALRQITQLSEALGAGNGLVTFPASAAQSGHAVTPGADGRLFYCDDEHSLWSLSQGTAPVRLYNFGRRVPALFHFGNGRLLALFERHAQVVDPRASGSGDRISVIAAKDSRVKTACAAVSAGRLLFAGYAGEIGILDPASAKVERLGSMPAAPDNCALSDNGSVALFTARLRAYRLDMASSDLEETRSFDAQCTCCALSASGRLAAYGFADGRILVAEEARDAVVADFHAHKERIAALRLGRDNDGPWLISAGIDGFLRLWRLAPLRCHLSWAPHQGRAAQFVLADGGFACALSEAGEVAWGKAGFSGMSAPFIPCLPKAPELALQEQSELDALVSRASGDFAAGRDAEAYALLKGLAGTLSIGHGRQIAAMLTSIAARHPRLAFLGMENRGLAVQERCRIEAGDIADGGGWFVGGDAEGVALWNLVTGERQSIGSLRQPMVAAAFSPDAKLAAAAGKFGKLLVFDCQQATTVAELQADCGILHTLVFHAGNAKLLASGADGASVFDLHNPQAAPVNYSVPSLQVAAAALAEPGLLALAVPGHGIILWDLRYPRPSGLLKTPGKRLARLKFMPDCALFAAATQAGGIHIFDPDSREQLGINNPDETGRDIYDLQFSADGRFLAAPAADGWLKVWRLDGEGGKFRFVPQAELQGGGGWRFWVEPGFTAADVGIQGNIYRYQPEWDLDFSKVSDIASAPPPRWDEPEFNPVRHFIAGIRLPRSGVARRSAIAAMVCLSVLTFCLAGYVWLRFFASTRTLVGTFGGSIGSTVIMQRGLRALPDLLRIIEKDKDAPKSPWHGFVKVEHRRQAERYDNASLCLEKLLTEKWPHLVSWIATAPEKQHDAALTAGRLLLGKAEALDAAARQKFLLAVIDLAARTQSHGQDAVRLAVDAHLKLSAPGDGRQAFLRLLDREEPEVLAVAASGAIALELAAKIPQKVGEKLLLNPHADIAGVGLQIVLASRPIRDNETALLLERFPEQADIVAGIAGILRNAPEIPEGLARFYAEKALVNGNSAIASAALQVLENPALRGKQFVVDALFAAAEKNSGAAGGRASVASQAASALRKHAPLDAVPDSFRNHYPLIAVELVMENNPALALEILTGLIEADLPHGWRRAESSASRFGFSSYNRNAGTYLGLLEKMGNKAVAAIPYVLAMYKYRMVSSSRTGEVLASFGRPLDNDVAQILDAAAQDNDIALALPYKFPAKYLEKWVSENVLTDKTDRYRACRMQKLPGLNHAILKVAYSELTKTPPPVQAVVSMERNRHEETIRNALYAASDADKEEYGNRMIQYHMQSREPVYAWILMRQAQICPSAGLRLLRQSLLKKMQNIGINPEFALDTIVEIGPAAAPLRPDLVAFLKAVPYTSEFDDCKVRAGAIRALMSINGISAELIPELTRSMQINYSMVQKAAISALSSLGAEARPAVPAMLKISQDSNHDYDVRQSIDEAIGIITGTAKPEPAADSGNIPFASPFQLFGPARKR